LVSRVEFAVEALLEYVSDDDMQILQDLAGKARKNSMMDSIVLVEGIRNALDVYDRSGLARDDIRSLFENLDQTYIV